MTSRLKGSFYFLCGLSWPALLDPCCLITTLTSAAESAVRRAAAETRLHFNIFISYANTDPVEPVIIQREPSWNGNDSVLFVYYSWPQTGQTITGLSVASVLLLFGLSQQSFSLSLHLRRAK